VPKIKSALWPDPDQEKGTYSNALLVLPAFLAMISLDFFYLNISCCRKEAQPILHFNSVSVAGSRTSSILDEEE